MQFSESVEVCEMAERTLDFEFLNKTPTINNITSWY